MLWTFLLSALAGYLVPRAQPALEGALAAVLGARPPLDAGEMRVLTLVTMMGLAALLATALGADTSAFAAALGAGLGYFGLRLYGFLRDPHGTDDVPEDARWDGSLREGRAVRRPHAGADVDADAPIAEPDDEETLRAVADAVRAPDPDAGDAPADRGTDTQESRK